MTKLIVNLAKRICGYNSNPKVNYLLYELEDWKLFNLYKGNSTEEFYLWQLAKDTSDE